MTHTNQILIVDPATHTPELDCFNQISCVSKLPCSYHLPALFTMNSIEMIPKNFYAGIIVFGAGCSVYDKLSWHDAFNQWLKKSMLSGIPTLGLCYGHQIIADLFGGKIDYYNSEHEKLRGFRETTFNKDTRLELESSTGNLVVSHNEIVVEIPKGFEEWATSPSCPNDGIRHKSLPIWSTQAHLEATSNFLTNQNIDQPTSSDDFAFGNNMVKAFIEFVQK